MRQPVCRAARQGVAASAALSRQGVAASAALSPPVVRQPVCRATRQGTGASAVHSPLRTEELVSPCPRLS